MKRIRYPENRVYKAVYHESDFFWEPDDPYKGRDSYKSKKKFTPPKPRYISEIPLGNGKKILMAPCPMSSGSLFRDDDEYIMHFLKEGVGTIVLMLEERSLIKWYENWGLNVIHIPIRDFSIPKDLGSFDRSIHLVRKQLNRHSVLFHCMGGNGRTGLVVASMFAQMGMEPDKAIKMVRKYRKEAIETKEQEDFIFDYYDMLH